MDSINRNKIRGIMAENRMTFKELSEKSGFSETTVSNFLNGQNPSYMLMLGIKKALNLDAQTASDIFFNTDLPVA